jgi:NAD(P)-dependent dehydrogenase (short-subunit alcohol dehydrogenase family)
MNGSHSERSGTQPVAIVTGGSQGLGLALSRALAHRGYALVIDARRADRLDGATNELAGLTTVVGIGGDITDADHRRRLIEAATRLGRIDLLVNNASTLGASPLPTIDDIDLDVLRQTYETNVVAPIALYQAAIPHLAQHATIVNITSDAAAEAYPSWGGYGATKAALEQASRVLAAERTDLRILTVDPGDMRTEMHQDAFPGEDISDRPDPEASVPGLLTLIEGDQPSGRYAARSVPTADEHSQAV